MGCLRKPTNKIRHFATKRSIATGGCPRKPTNKFRHEEVDCDRGGAQQASPRRGRLQPPKPPTRLRPGGVPANPPTSFATKRSIDAPASGGVTEHWRLLYVEPFGCTRWRSDKVWQRQGRGGREEGRRRSRRKRERKKEVTSNRHCRHLDQPLEGWDRCSSGVITDHQLRNHRPQCRTWGPTERPSPKRSRPRTQGILYTVFCILYAVCCMLFAVCYMLYTKHYIRYTIHYILYTYTIYYLLYTIYYILYTIQLMRDTI